MFSINVEGMLFWGIDKGRVTIKEVMNIVSPPDSILHLLRHFISIPEDWIGQVVAKGITTLDFIKEQLRFPGSKWNPDVNLQTPEEVIRFSQELLLESFQQGRELKWIGRGKVDLCLFFHSVTPEEKRRFLKCNLTEQPMGTRGLVSLGEISPGAEVYQVPGRGGDIPVNVVEMNPPTTDTIVITLARRENGTIQIWSAFPGILTPPFPKAGQLPEEYEYNKSFWERYALIEVKEGGVSCLTPV